MKIIQINKMNFINVNSIGGFYIDDYDGKHTVAFYDNIYDQMKLRTDSFNSYEEALNFVKSLNIVAKFIETETKI